MTLRASVAGAYNWRRRAAYEASNCAAERFAMKGSNMTPHTTRSVTSFTLQRRRSVRSDVSFWPALSSVPAGCCGSGASGGGGSNTGSRRSAT